MPFFHPISILAILIAISVHECAHALAAKYLGDHTAEDAGRLTINPLAHVDPLGAILFLTVGFGWAKPVPVNPWNFRHPRRDNALVALAGPGSNLFMAFLAFCGLQLLGMHPQSFGMGFAAHGMAVGSQFMVLFCEYSLYVNLGLMAFNLLPIAPLDGSKIVEPFIPRSWEEGFELLTRNGPFILLAVLIIEHATSFPILSAWIYTIADFVVKIFAALFAFIG